MKDRTTYAIALIALAASVFLLGAVPSPAADGLPAGASQALERSALSAPDRSLIADRAREAVRAGLPAEDVEIIISRALDRGADAAALERFLDTPLRTQQQGLPVRPVLDRIEQGLSKGIPLERIDAAATRLADGLAKARPVVDGLLQAGLAPGPRGARDAAIESIARAGEQSVPDSLVHSTGETARQQGQSLAQFDRAVRTLTFLAGAGVPPDAAARLVRSGMERGWSDRDFGRLERRVSDMVREGRGPDEIVRSAEREIREDRGPGDGRSGGAQDRGFGGGRDAGGRGGRGR